LTSYFPANPASSTAIRNLGIAWAQIAEDYNTPQLLDKAWPMLRDAASPRVQDPLLYGKVGEALDSASKTAEAEKVYRLSLEQDPQQLDVLLRLAALLERSGKHTEAAALRKRAASILPRQSE
jgi:tetratricopeptide (TPR) repeat protein